MGSDIQIDSQPGKGSCFWFEIAVPAEAELAAIPAAPAITGYQGPRREVLIVDDVEANRAMLVDLLGGLGFGTAEAVNGQEGLELAQTIAPDLIVMDMVMPVMDGLEATRRIRRTPGIQAIPIIAVSASATPEDQAACLAAGTNAFLPKPIEQANLLRQIGTLLNLSWEHEQTEVQEVREGPLVAPPRAELQALHELALTGNMREIREWAANLAERDRQYRPFADRLRELADCYQSKAILDLVDECRGRTGSL
jgi:CheY-like chemotaxis protein